MEEFLITINEDGVLYPYNSKYDIVIHCENAEEQAGAIKKLTAMNLTTGIDVEEAAKALKIHCANTKCGECIFKGIGCCKIDNLPGMWDIEVG